MPVDVAEIPDGYLNGVAACLSSLLPAVVREQRTDLHRFTRADHDPAKLSEAGRFRGRFRRRLTVIIRAPQHQSCQQSDH